MKKAVAARKNTYEKDDRALGFLILMRGLFLSVLPRRAVQPWEALITKKRVKRFLGLTANRRNSLPSRQTIGCGTTSRIPSLLEKMLFPQPLGQLCGVLAQITYPSPGRRLQARQAGKELKTIS